MRIPRPTRTKRFTESLSDSEIATAKEWGEQHVFGRALLSLLESNEDAKLALLDENEALAKALELCQSTCHLKHDAAVATQAALAEYAKRKQEREGM